MTRRFRHLSLVSLVCALTAACGGDDDAPAAVDPPASIDAPAVDGPLAVDAPSATDAASIDSPGASPSEINCGASVCDRATQVCCFTGFPNITTTCTATAQCTNLPGRCDGPEDCSGGNICCGTPQGSDCRPAAECTGMTSARLCHTAADCVSGQICRTSQFVAWPICAMM